MIMESAILGFCIYGILKSDNLLKLAAFTSFLAYPALLMFTKSGAEELVLLLLAIEAVPFAFGLLLLKTGGTTKFKKEFVK